MMNPEKMRENYTGALDEFEKELENSSDRGIALVCGSIIDYQLGDLLKFFLIPSNKIDNDLFKGTAPLATFDAKLKLAFYLGLLTEGEKKNITYLQRIRNRFAHQFLNISFENDDIKNLCSNFVIKKNTFVPHRIPVQNTHNSGIELQKVDLNPIKKDTTAKERFILIFRHLYMSIVSKTFQNENLIQRTELKEEPTADEFAYRLYQITTSKLSDLIKIYKELEEKIYVKKQEKTDIVIEKELENISLEQLEFTKEQIEHDIHSHNMLAEIHRSSYEIIKNSLE